MPLFLVGLIGAAVIMLPIMVISSLVEFPETVLELTNPFALAGVLGAFVLIALVGFVLYPLAWGGQAAAVRDVLAGATVQVGHFFQSATRFYARLLVYSILVGLTWFAFAIINVIPVLGQVLFFVAAICLGPAFLFFAPYALVSEELTASAAYRLAWRCVTRRFTEVLVSGLVLTGLGIALSILSALMGLVPVLGTLMHLAMAAAATPFLLLYMAMRYTAGIRPHLVEQSNSQ